MRDYCVNATDGSTVRAADDTSIANFNIKLRSVSKYRVGSDIIKKYQLEFYNPDFVCSAEVEPKELDRLKYSELDDSLLLSPTVSTAAKEMAYYVRSQVKTADIKEVLTFNKLGWHCLEENHYYCAGDTLICGVSPENYRIDDALSKKYHFEISQSMSEREACRYSLKLMNIESDTTSLIFVSGLMGIMRQLIMDADIRIPCITYVQGASQTRKTTVTNLCTRMYNRGKLSSDSSVSSMRVSSSNFKTEEIAEHLKDTSFILDDLYREQDTRLRKLYESHVRNLIRNFADNASRNTARSNFSINCNLIVTAEYLLKSKTDVGRMMLIHIDKPINSERLAECQKDPLGLSTFYYFFIKWVSVHYDKIVMRLRQEYTTFRAGSFEHQCKFERLYEQIFLMGFVFGVYVDYVKSIGFDVDKESLSAIFYNYAKKALKKQSDILKDIEAGETTDINFSEEIILMIENGDICLGKKGADCFKKGKFLYVTSNCFGKALSDKYKRPFTAKKISSYFRDRYISEVYADNTGKKYDGKRYLCLNIAELQKDAGSDSDKISGLFFD